MHEALKKSLPMGLACSIATLGYALMMHESIDNAPISASIISVCGTFLAGTAIWYWLVAKNNRYTATRGCLAGIVTGWLSQYFGLSGALVVELLADFSSLEDPLFQLLKTLVLAPFFTIFTFIFYGWVVVAFCSLAGILLAKIQKRAIGNDIR